MYCYHCGKEINEHKALNKMRDGVENHLIDRSKMNDKTVTAFVCPRCGHLIKRGATERNYKELSRAAHAQIQRASNSFANGMGMVCIGVIALALAILFFLLAKKPTNQYILVTTCTEFYVSVIGFAAAVILLSLGITFVTRGLLTKQRYTNLLKDINNKTFIQ